MGYDSEKREIKMGMLAEKTHPYIRDKVIIITNTNTHIQIQKHPNTNIIKWWKRLTPNIQDYINIEMKCSRKLP